MTIPPWWRERVVVYYLLLFLISEYKRKEIANQTDNKSLECQYLRVVIHRIKPWIYFNRLQLPYGGCD